MRLYSFECRIQLHEGSCTLTYYSEMIELQVVFQFTTAKRFDTI